MTILPQSLKMMFPDKFRTCLLLTHVLTGVYFWLCYGVGSILGVGPLYLLDIIGAEQWQLGEHEMLSTWKLLDTKKIVECF